MNKTVILNLRSIKDNLTDEQIADNIRGLLHPALLVDIRVADEPEIEKKHDGYILISVKGDLAARIKDFGDGIEVSWLARGFVPPDIARAYALAILRAADVAEEMSDGNP